MIRTSDWTPCGYPKLANLMSYERDAAIFRRFGGLTMLNIINLQAELIHLEHKYAEACKDDDISADENEKLFSSDFYRLEKFDQRSDCQRDILHRIGIKLEQYQKAILQASYVDAVPAASKRDMAFLNKWLVGTSEGNKFLKGRERFTWRSQDQQKNAALWEKEYLTLAKPSERLLQPWLVDIYHWMWGGKPGHRKVVDPELGRVLDYSPEGSMVISLGTKFFDLFGVILTSVLPMIAVVVLFLVKNTLKRIGLSIVFSAVFGLTLKLLTSANIKEIFAATTAFAAVEVVFIGSVNT